ncbi:hypothetical protein TWF696_006808 [Orbilia brochopaga]|uniref:Uncharacterized protein n=1 Tax=Orbilia brochopaga TaxID=3140254 RepID=A0AAV9UTA6_9PEZI
MAPGSSDQALQTSPSALDLSGSGNAPSIIVRPRGTCTGRLEHHVPQDLSYNMNRWLASPPRQDPPTPESFHAQGGRVFSAEVDRMIELDLEKDE